MMNMNSTTRTVESMDSSPASRRANVRETGMCAPRRGADVPSARAMVPERRMRYRVTMASVALMCMLLVAYVPRAIADEVPCVAEIVKMVPGMIRIRDGDGKPKKVDSASLPTPLCVVEVMKTKARYRVDVEDGELKGEWLIKRREVVKVVGAMDVDCSRAIVTAGVKIKDIPTPGGRASGEEPCE